MRNIYRHKNRMALNHMDDLIQIRNPNGVKSMIPVVTQLLPNTFEFTIRLFLSSILHY